MLERQDEIYKDICLLVAVQEGQVQGRHAVLRSRGTGGQDGRARQEAGDEARERRGTRNGRAADIQDVLYGLGRRVSLMTELPDKSHPKHGSKNDDIVQRIC